MQFETYAEPTSDEYDSYSLSEHVGTLLIVKVREYRTGIVTKHSPEGKAGVTVDLVDLKDGETYRSVLWMNAAVADGLKGYAGKNPVVVSPAYRTGKSGNDYIVMTPADDKQLQYAQEWVSKNGDPFAPVLSTVPTQNAAPADDAPPWARG